jgi:hypothetical protein
MALAKKPLEIFQQVTAKSAEELAGVSAMFVVVRAKWNASHHIRRPFRQNDALRYVFCLGTYVSYIRKLMFREVVGLLPKRQAQRVGQRRQR